MRRLNCVFTFVLIAAFALVVRAASPTTKPTTRPSGGRLFAPYSKMTSLNDEQRNHIREIHRKALAAIHDIESKQTEDIMALLNDDQKKELHEIEAQETAAKKTAGAKPDGTATEEK